MIKSTWNITSAIAYVFLRPPIFQGLEYQPKQEISQLPIKKDDVAKAFLCQSEKKALD